MPGYSGGGIASPRGNANSMGQGFAQQNNMQPNQMTGQRPAMQQPGFSGQRGATKERLPSMYGGQMQALYGGGGLGPSTGMQGPPPPMNPSQQSMGMGGQPPMSPYGNMGYGMSGGGVTGYGGGQPSGLGPSNMSQYNYGQEQPGRINPGAPGKAMPRMGMY